MCLYIFVIFICFFHAFIITWLGAQSFMRMYMCAMSDQVQNSQVEKAPDVSRL